MKNSYYSLAYLGPEKKIVQVTFQENSNYRQLVPHLRSFFQSKLKAGFTQWLFDFDRVTVPNTSLIAFLISATEQARYMGGDVKIINVNDSASNSIVAFNALSYMTVEYSDRQALRDFGIELEDDSIVAPIDLDAGDIVEPAIWDSISASDEFLDNSTSKVVTDEVVTKTAPRKPKPRKTTAKPVVRAQKARRAPKNRYYLRAESVTSNLYKICDFVVEHALRAGIPEKQVGKIKISVYEACVNVIEHAYHSQPDNWIECWIEYNPALFKIIIQDYGTAFKDPGLQQYNVEDAIEARQTGGFGRHIIERSMDSIEYQTDPINGNRLTMLKKLPVR